MKSGQPLTLPEEGSSPRLSFPICPVGRKPKYSSHRMARRTEGPRRRYSHPARPSRGPPCLPHADRSFPHLVQVVIESLWVGGEVSGLRRSSETREPPSQGCPSSEDKKPVASQSSEACSQQAAVQARQEEGANAWALGEVAEGLTPSASRVSQTSFSTL